MEAKNTGQKAVASARRTQILEAAARVFAEKGFHPSTVRDVARAARVADGTIYNYFENKSALLLGLLGLMTERARGQVDPATLAGADLRGLTRLYLSGPLEAMSANNAELFRVIVSEVVVNPEVREGFYAQLLGPMLQAGEAAFTHALSRPGQPADASQVALQVRALSGLILGLILQRVMGDELLAAHWEKLPDLLADLLVNGMARPEGSEQP